MAEKNAHVLLQQIPMLESTDQFIDWDLNMRDYLAIQGFEELLNDDDDSQEPGQLQDEADLVFRSRKKDWKLKQSKAMGAVKHCLGYNIRLRVKDCVLLKEMMKTIDAEMRPGGSTVFQSLAAKYDELSLQSCSSVQDFAKKLRKIRSEFVTLGKTCDIGEPHFVNKFLSGLGPEFDIFKTAFFQTLSLIEIEAAGTLAAVAAVTFSEVLREADREESAIKIRNVPSAMFSSNNRRTYSAPTEAPKSDTVAGPGQILQAVDVCSHCHKTRHTVDRCHKLHPELNPRANGSAGAKGGGAQSKKRKPNDEPVDDSQKAMVIRPADSTFGFMAAGSTTGNMTKCFILDSGCTQHCSARVDLFTNLRPYYGPALAGIGGISVIPTEIGSLNIPVNINGKRLILSLHNSILCPDLGVNLVSVAQILARGGDVKFHANYATITHPEHTVYAPNRLGLFLLDVWEDSSPAPIALTAYGIDDPNLQIWHERLGHLGEQALRRLQKMSTGIAPVPTHCLCEPCVLGRMKEMPHKGHIQPGRHPMDLIHTDIAGPFPVPGVNGERYWCVLLDDHTQAASVPTLKSRDEFLSAFDSFLKANETPERKCHRVRLDKAGENISDEFTAYCTDRSIVIETTATEQHQQNGAAEVLNRIMMEKLQPTMIQADLDLKWWPYVLEAMAYVRMRCPSTKLDKTPYEALTGDVPDLSHIRTIGSPGYVWIKRSGRKKMLHEKSRPCRLLGYKGNSIYQLLTPDGKVIEANNVVFNEKRAHIPDLHEAVRSEYKSAVSSLQGEAASESVSGPKELALGLKDPELNLKQTSMFTPLSAGPITRSKRHAIDDDSSSKRMCRESISQESGSGLFVEDIHNMGHSEEAQHRTELPSEDHLQQPPPKNPPPVTQQPHIRMSIRENKGIKPLRYGYMLLASFLANIVEAFEPKTLEQAQNDSMWPAWKRGMNDEMASLIYNHTWDLVDRPPSAKVLRGKWVFKNKRGLDGNVARHKARWVVRGFEQREGIDYSETFASVVKPMSYKALFAIAAAQGLHIEQMDVKTAFLYGKIQETIYVEQPTGLAEVSGKVCKLIRALYGLKQAPRVWYTTLKEFLATLSFIPLSADPGVFTRGDMYIAVYVDDLLIIGPSMPEISEIKSELSRRFQMSDLGPCAYYLGMSIVRDLPNRVLRLSQRGYIEQVLRHFGMWDANPVDLPMSTTTKLVPQPEDYEAPPEDKEWYASAVGSLMYLMLGTRPDIAYCISVLSRYLGNPGPPHITGIKTLMRYLRGSLNFDLVFRGDLLALTGFTDSDWAGDTDTRRSTAGYIFNLGSGAISWSSKRQPTVALSSTEAEYMGQTQATKEAVWLRRLLDELNLRNSPADLITTVIYGDNQGAIALAKNPQFHARSKHIAIQHNFVREMVASGEVDIRYVSTHEQVADGLTKALSKAHFSRFRSAIGLELRE